LKGVDKEDKGAPGAEGNNLYYALCPTPHNIQNNITHNALKSKVIITSYKVML